MKNILITAAILLTATLSQAAYYSSSKSTVTGIIGFASGAVNFGANYEHHIDAMGVGGYFNYNSEEKTSGRNQIVSFGALAPLHLLDDSKYDVTVAPGFGISMVKGLPGNDDQTVFGPLWKISTFFKMTSTIKIGLEHTELVNWFSNKVAADIRYTSFAVGFAF